MRRVARVPSLGLHYQHPVSLPAASVAAQSGSPVAYCASVGPHSIARSGHSTTEELEDSPEAEGASSWKYTHSTTEHTTFATAPGFSMSTTFSSPEENTIAFGGVAIGSMNANDVERAAGTRSSIGLTCRLAARAATIGIATIVVAALEVQLVLRARSHDNEEVPYERHRCLKKRHVSGSPK